jgi:hypothetical protein
VYRTEMHTDPPIQKLLHAVDILCINYYEAFQRKQRANSWNDCHSRIECLDSKSVIKNPLGFRACNLQHVRLASGRAVFSSCGADPSKAKKRLPVVPPYGIPSPSAEQRKGPRPMGGFWPRMIYVVKKGHARDIYFLLQTRSFWHFSAPSFLLRAAIYSPGRQCLSSAVYWLISQ